MTCVSNIEMQPDLRDHARYVAQIAIRAPNIDATADHAIDPVHGSIHY